MIFLKIHTLTVELLGRCGVKKTGSCRSYRYGKRALDLLLSILLLCFLCLPMLVIAACVGLTSRGGVLFRQVRVGQGGVPFVCYKFRTMYVDAPRDCPTSAFSDAARFVTPIGRFLRRSSLDELPQLWNVLRGEMSLVGPGPLIPCEEKILAWRMRCGVYRLRPGITGLAQVCGRDRLPDVEKTRLDVRYARQVSFWNDARIVGKTLLRVVSGDGVASARRSVEKI